MEGKEGILKKKRTDQKTIKNLHDRIEAQFFNIKIKDKLENLN